MGLTITLEDFEGGIIKKLPEEISPDLFEGLPVERFHLLKYIDRYDDTTFNSLMCKDLITDLKNLKEHKLEDHNQIDEILQLVSGCIYGAHTYVKFLGD